MYHSEGDKMLRDYKIENSAGTNLKTMYNFLHFVPAQVEVALDEITINEASHWLRLLICVKRPPAESNVNGNNLSLFSQQWRY